MNESAALRKKCPYQFNTELHEFDYCITSDCMSWTQEDKEEGYCKRLIEESCKCQEKECDMS